MDAEIATKKSKTEPQDDSSFKRVPVFLTVIFSLVTAGIYIPCWFLSRRKLLNQTYSSEAISIVPPVIILMLYSFAIAAFIPVQLFGTIWGLAFYNYFNTVITYLGIAVILYLSFQTRSLLNGLFEKKKFSALCTFLFNIWYLQYKMNRCTKYNK